MFHELFPWRRLLIGWQLISHKFLRPFVAWAMIGALITNIILVIWPPAQSSHDILRLARPFNWIILIMQLAFYGMAVFGKIVEPSGAIGKILYLPKFLVYSNVATLIGFFRFIKGSQSPIWERVQRRDMS